MKNKVGKIGGFFLGATSFLLMFKLIILDHIPPSDELAPGIVVMASILNGFLFAFIGSLIQNYFVKKRTYQGGSSIKTDEQVRGKFSNSISTK